MPNPTVPHAHADDAAGIWDDLVNKLNVTVHDNPFTTVDYPYEPQGSFPSTTSATATENKILLLRKAVRRRKKKKKKKNTHSHTHTHTAHCMTDGDAAPTLQQKRSGGACRSSLHFFLAMLS